MTRRKSPAEIAQAKAERQRRWRQAKRERELLEREAEHVLGLDDVDEAPVRVRVDSGKYIPIERFSHEELIGQLGRNIAKRWKLSPAAGRAAAVSGRWSFASQEEADAFARLIDGGDTGGAA